MKNTVWSNWMDRCHKVDILWVVLVLYLGLRAQPCMTITVVRVIMAASAPKYNISTKLISNLWHVDDTFRLVPSVVVGVSCVDRVIRVSILSAPVVSKQNCAPSRAIVGPNLRPRGTRTQTGDPFLGRLKNYSGSQENMWTEGQTAATINHLSSLPCLVKPTRWVRLTQFISPLCVTSPCRHGNRRG